MAPFPLADQEEVLAAITDVAFFLFAATPYVFAAAFGTDHFRLERTFSTITIAAQITATTEHIPMANIPTTKTNSNITPPFLCRLK